MTRRMNHTVPSPPKIRRFKHQPQRPTPALIIWLFLIVFCTASSTWLLLQNIIAGESNRERLGRKLQKQVLRNQHQQDTTTKQAANNNIRKPLSSSDHSQLNEYQCRKYGFSFPNANNPPSTPQRVFFGTLITDETWELLHEVANERYGLFTGMVFLKDENSYNTTLPFHENAIRDLLGSPKIQIRSLLSYENHVQPQEQNEIQNAWNEMGMKPNDIGLLGDVGDCSIQAFLQAWGACDGIHSFGSNKSRCHEATTNNSFILQPKDSECVVYCLAPKQEIGTSLVDAG